MFLNNFCKRILIPLFSLMIFTHSNIHGSQSKNPFYFGIILNGFLHQGDNFAFSDSPDDIYETITLSQEEFNKEVEKYKQLSDEDIRASIKAHLEGRKHIHNIPLFPQKTKS